MFAHRFTPIVTWTLIVALFSVPVSSADILDQILNGVTSNGDRIETCINRATTARDRATDAAQNSGEIVDHVRESVANITDEVRTAIQDAFDDLRQTVAEETAGLTEFTADGGPAEPFRQELIGLLSDFEGLLSSAYGVSGLTMDVDVSRLIGTVQALPRRALFPLYKAMTVDTQFGTSGFRDRVPDLIDIYNRFVTLISEPEPAGDTVLDQELDRCARFESLMANHDVQRMAEWGAANKLLAKSWHAIGRTKIKGYGGGHGYLGTVIESDLASKIGDFHDCLADVTFMLTNYVNINRRHCSQIHVQEEVRAREELILAQQAEILRYLKRLDAKGK